MSIIDLQRSPKTDQEFQVWAWAHRVEHTRIRNRIQALGGPNLQDLQLEPINTNDMTGWLERHQQAHEDMTLATNVQSVDLQTVDFKKPDEVNAWIEIHYREHFDVNSVLRI